MFYSTTNLRMVRVAPIKGRHCRFIRIINVALHGFFQEEKSVTAAIEFSDGAVEFIPVDDYAIEFTGAILHITPGEGHGITEEKWSVRPAAYTTKPDTVQKLDNPLPNLEKYIGLPVPVENTENLQKIADNVNEVTNGKPSED